MSNELPLTCEPSTPVFRVAATSRPALAKQRGLLDGQSVKTRGDVSSASILAVDDPQLFDSVQLCHFQDTLQLDGGLFGEDNRTRCHPAPD
jgi:hypothetical protein